MFFPCRTLVLYFKSIRKERCVLPAGNHSVRGRERRFPVIFSKGSMTLETACVLPLLLFAMLSVLQFAQIGLSSAALLAGMQDTAKDMAAYAYIQEMGVSAGDSIPAELLQGGISAFYARKRIEAKSGFTGNSGSFSLLQSSLLKNNIIDVAVTYEPNQTFLLLPVPKVKAVLRARVRAWTGREGSGGNAEKGSEGNEEKEETVYVAATGKVYHKDENCSHIKLSIRTVSRDSLKTRRNAAGGKYHACERCADSGSPSVYVTDYGDKYHSSLNCSGLKRSIKEIPVSEVKGWKPCSKCGGK